ncbi:MAG: SEC-C domain-containing protein [Acidimicrobiales bacterium]
MDEQTEDRDAAVSAELEQLLLAQGPLTLDELAAAYAAAAPEAAAELAPGGPSGLADRLNLIARRGDAFWRLPDGRLAPVLHRLRRAVFTHRLSSGEVAREAVDLCPDLVALALPTEFTLAGGVDVHLSVGGEDPRAAEHGSLVGPVGWLSGRTAGDLLAVRYDGEQVGLEVIPDSELDPAAGRAAADALRHAFASLDRRRAPEVHRLTVDAIGAQPDCFATPTRPIGELLADAGIEVRGAWAGPADQAWPTPPEQVRLERLEARLAGAEGCCRRSAQQALAAWFAWLAERERAEREPTAEPAPPADAAGLAADVDHGAVAALLAEAASIGRAAVSLRRLGEWADEVAAAAGSSPAGLEYLRALGRDAAGDGQAAEAHLLAGLATAPDHPACLGLLAELEQDRGDAVRSLALLRRAGRPAAAATMQELAPFLAAGDVKRNDPCPCGSGRKYKACCSGRTLRRPLAERAQWLLVKATRHAVRFDPLGYDSLRRLFDSSGSADGDALALDMLLFQVGGLARYLAGRGALLPADELACASGWPAEQFRLLEVDAPDPASPGAAVDQRSGERLTLTGGSVAELRHGEVVLARALPVGEVWILSGAVIRLPPGSRSRANALVESEVRPFQLLELLIDVQVDSIRERAPQL